MSDTSTNAEREVLMQAAAGDQLAVRALYRAHVNRVFATAARILGRADGEVEDVVQNTFLAALDGAHTFDGRSKVSTWLVGIAVRRSLDAVRERQRRHRWSKMRELVGMGRAPSSPALRLETQSLAERLLGQLSDDQRIVFVLHNIEGHTLQEISEMTSTGISTLHARLLSGRKKLDALLEAIGPLEMEAAEQGESERNFPEGGTEDYARES